PTRRRLTARCDDSWMESPNTRFPNGPESSGQTPDPAPILSRGWGNEQTVFILRFCRENSIYFPASPGEKHQIFGRSLSMPYQHIQAPAGSKISISGGKLRVPDQPIIPFIEGDGTGPDIWRASVRVMDAAVSKAYGGKRRIAWMEVHAGEKSFKQ